MHSDLDRFLALVPPRHRSWQTYDDRRLADGRPRRDRRLSRKRHGDYCRHADLLARLNTPDIGAAVTITVNQTDGCGRRAGNITRIAAIAADIDHALPDLPLDPGLVVETSPGRHQVWWPLDDESTLTRAQHAGIMSALVVAYGADAAAIDIARVLRVPSFFNNKAAPFRVRIIGGTQSFTTGSALIAAFPTPLAVPKPPVASTGVTPKTPPGLGSLADPLAALPADDYRTWITVGAALHGETGGAADGLALWKSWSSTSAKYDAAVCEARWTTFRNPDRVARAGKIFWLAAQHGFSRHRSATRSTTTPPA